MNFTGREIRDLLAAWSALGVAFAFFFGGGAAILQRPDAFVRLLIVSVTTAGVGFLLHELAHKVVAIRFDQIAEFRADYGMLFLAVASALAGFIFAAPGAVHHRGYITERENGLIAVAGPVTNLLLVAVFLPFLVVPIELLYQIGRFGVTINAFLAAFNMLPFGPLDGRTVLSWSFPAFLATFLFSLALTAVAFVFVYL